MPAPPDPALCPLCGAPNDCARARDPQAPGCWCRGERFEAELLERVPAPARGAACVCRRCAREAPRGAGGS